MYVRRIISTGKNKTFTGKTMILTGKFFWIASVIPIFSKRWKTTNYDQQKRSMSEPADGLCIFI
jgi:hypothetical protein